MTHSQNWKPYIHLSILSQLAQWLLKIQSLKLTNLFSLFHDNLPLAGPSVIRSPKDATSQVCWSELWVLEIIFNSLTHVHTTWISPLRKGYDHLKKKKLKFLHTRIFCARFDKIGRVLLEKILTEEITTKCMEFTIKSANKYSKPFIIDKFFIICG